jgi:hypothetical protein
MMSTTTTRRSRWRVRAVLALLVIAGSATTEAQAPSQAMPVCVWIMGLPVCFDYCQVDPRACQY